MYPHPMGNSELFSYVPVPSAFGTLGIAWRETEAGPQVYRVLLPNEQALAQGAALRACSAIVELADHMRRFLAGDAVEFDLGLVALDTCPEFQRRVLLAEYGVPRGWVTTYGRIAAYVGVPRGARAVGSALAHNPFPIIVPCHRAVRSDGHLGGFRGGLEMKRALLEMEGVAVGPTGKVLTDQFHFACKNSITIAPPVSGAASAPIEPRPRAPRPGRCGNR